MHGPEHWLGLARAWLVVGLFVYAVWTALDWVGPRVVTAVRQLS